MTSTVTQNPPSNTVPKPILAWKVHLMRENPEKLAWILPMCLGAIFCGSFLMGYFGVAVVVLAMVTTLADYLFPMRFILTTEKAICRRQFGSSEICWNNVKRYYIDDYGIKLSPLSRLTRLEAYRGVYLRFDKNKEQIIEAVKSLRDNNV